MITKNKFVKLAVFWWIASFGIWPFLTPEHGTYGFIALVDLIVHSWGFVMLLVVSFIIIRDSITEIKRLKEEIKVTEEEIKVTEEEIRSIHEKIINRFQREIENYDGT